MEKSDSIKPKVVPYGNKSYGGMKIPMYPTSSPPLQDSAGGSPTQGTFFHGASSPTDHPFALSPLHQRNTSNQSFNQLNQFNISPVPNRQTGSTPAGQTSPKKLSMQADSNKNPLMTLSSSIAYPKKLVPVTEPLQQNLTCSFCNRQIMTNIDRELTSKAKKCMLILCLTTLICWFWVLFLENSYLYFHSCPCCKRSLRKREDEREEI